MLGLKEHFGFRKSDRIVLFYQKIVCFDPQASSALDPTQFAYTFFEFFFLTDVSFGLPTRESQEDILLS